MYYFHSFYSGKFEQTVHWFYCKVYIKLYFVFIWLNMIFCYVFSFNMYV